MAWFAVLVLLLLSASSCAPFARAKRCEELKAGLAGLEASTFLLREPADFQKLSATLHQTQERLLVLPPSGAELASVREGLHAKLEKLENAVNDTHQSLSKQQRSPYRANSVRAREAAADLQHLAREFGERCR